MATSLFYRSLQPASLFYLENLQKKANYKTEYSREQRRLITFAINAKKGKHKTNTPAASRARLLGQLKYYSLSAKAMISQCENLLRGSATDLPPSNYYELCNEVEYAKIVIANFLLPAIESTLNLTSKKRKKQTS